MIIPIAAPLVDYYFKNVANVLGSRTQLECGKYEYRIIGINQPQEFLENARTIHWRFLTKYD